MSVYGHCANNLSQMRILLTGAAGFIGALVTQQLKEQDYDFLATDIVEPSERLKGSLDNNRYEQTDLCDSGQIEKLIKQYKPTHIIHAAGIMGGAAELKPVLSLQVNLLSTAILVETGIKNGLMRFILPTTIGVYDPCTPEPIKDDSKKNPANIYGISKLGSEYLLEWYHRAHKLSIGAARLPWVFGPGRVRGLTADRSTKLLDSIARGESIHVTNPYERGDWMYGPDGARALMTMLNPGEKQKQFAYYFSGAGVYTVQEVMMLANQICSDAKVSFENSPKPENAYASVFDDSKTVRDFGWKPDYSLEKAIKDHIETVRKLKA